MRRGVAGPSTSARSPPAECSRGRREVCRARRLPIQQTPESRAVSVLGERRVDDGIRVTVHTRDDVVVLVARGDVRGDSAALVRLVGVALMALQDRPAVLDVCDLYVHRQDGLAALRWLLAQRPSDALTVVLARTALRRRMHGVFGSRVAWYPAELHTPWIGVSASLSHRRRHLPLAQRESESEAQIGTLLWAAARERDEQQRWEVTR